MLLLRPNSPSQSKPALFLALMAGLALGLPVAAQETGSAAGTESSGNPSPGDIGDRSPAGDKLLENILSKEGITLGGAFRSRYLHSSIRGPAVVPNIRSEESVEFTSVDFDIRARPNTATQGRLIFRMHQDWRNFFSDIGNPINTRWISIDGKVKEMFSYNVGDFRQRYSPLTLHAPEIGILYEPALFAGQRREAMDEAFLGNNDRLLQGVNLNLDAALDRAGSPLLREMHLNVLGSRLRNVETSIQNGSKPTNLVERSPVEKFLAGSNADLVLPFGLSLGGSYLYIFDKQGSYSGTGKSDTAAQKTGIFSGRGGFDLGPLMGSENWNIGVSAEYAMSSDDSSFFRAGNDSVVNSQSIDGSALFAR